MNRQELEQILTAITRARMAVIGDFCLDAYWFLDTTSGEQSLETGRPVHHAHRQRYSPGGAGNVLMNLRSLNAGSLFAFGVIGNDPFGPALERQLAGQGIDTAGMLTQAETWDTHVYGKPYLGHEEQERFDFGTGNRLHDRTAERLINSLRSVLPHVDAVIINEQISSGIHASPTLQQGLQQLIHDHPAMLFLLDSRHASDMYDGALRKLNDHEAVRLCGTTRAPQEPVLVDEARTAATELHARWEKPLVVTRGQYGCIVSDDQGLHEIPGLLILKETDTVGAGDSMLAGTAAGLAAGLDLLAAAAIGGFVAGVTVQKLFQTGTATPEEVLAIGSDPDYIYRPELAGEIRHARYVEGTDIEIDCGPTAEAVPAPVRDRARASHFTHVILDHDGTISTLRQGWEEIMHPLMVRAILGNSHDTVDQLQYNRVSHRIKDFIAKTTGIQTIRQMEGLAEMVRDSGFVLPENVLSPAEYKARYLSSLRRLVDDRVARLRRGELTVEDFVIKNAAEFLHALKQSGLRLYLASGTDHADVEAEATALGYAHLFEGRIYGAVDAQGHDVKKAVVRRILAEIGIDHGRSILGVGDGPVEIREVHRAGGFTVGVASDEVRRFGLNPEKRTRLIHAGADTVVPDYSQLSQIMRVLKLGR